ncbi:MAG: phosphoribosylformylglycinamidine synthase [Enterocloster bolteae]
MDSRQADEEKPETLVTEFEVPEDILYFDGFADSSEEELKALYGTLNLAMTFKDFLHIQNYYKKEEHRDPSVTEIRVLDTYWSDHCRHTTFSTELKNVSFTDGDYREPMEETYKQYLADREVIYKGRDDKYVCLMDLALMAMKKLRSEGKLQDMEVSDEINACSIVVPVEIDGATEEWLVNFKNETHNHPTEIEPFGGAATCLGGAIRDPLSGRTYVYQAMRVTGAADPTRPLGETLKGKLPQRKIVNSAAQGYSSYGNQIGLATGYVKEIYHPGYVAKRMEIGAVMGAAPRKDVIRETSDPGDIIILLGGRTGRDGIGGATGSSKVHTTSSIEVCGAEVQKGNAPTERKIQRMFRRPEVSRIIKKCNDFGAGGVSVAIGELAAGLKIDLDKVPKKYAGLDGTEIAISESQERMAVVVDPKDVDQFLGYAAEENLEAVTVAVVTEEPRLKMDWRGKTIVDLSRAFLDTNGAHQEADVTLEVPDRAGNLFDKADVADVREKWLGMLSDLNVCSQKGLVERFDGPIGAGSVFMPYGGRYQLTETQAMVAKLPVLKGHTDTVTMMSYGFDPRLSSWSPYHGAVYAVVSSVAKIVAAGGDYSRIRFTFQEYFRRMNENPSRWSQPFSALLGAYSAQLGFGLPSIGGKDSMSGTFDTEDGEINVPPTLVSFAVDVNSHKNVITPEFKRPGSKIVVFRIAKNQYDLPDYSQVMDGYGKMFKDIKAGRIISAYAVEGNGLAEAVSKMAFGNKLGVKIEHNVDPRDFFAAAWGDIVCEVPDGMVGQLSISYTVIGEVTDRGAFEYGNVTISMEEALDAWMTPLEDVVPLPQAGRQEERRLRWKRAVSQRRSVCATIKSDSQPYLFRYSREPTASMTAPGPLSGREQRWLPGCAT